MESLVQQLAQRGSTSTDHSVPSNVTSQSSRTESNEEENGISNGGISNDLAYSGSTHWSAMLEDIEELRFAIAPEEISADQDSRSEADVLGGGVDIIFGSSKS